MAKKKKPTGDMVLVDAKVLAAATAENAAKEDPFELRKELITEPIDAELAPGLLAHHDPALAYVDITLGKEKARILKTDLWQFVFSTCSAQVRDQLMPIRQTEVMHYTKIHNVQLKRDMRAGEIMKVRCHTDVPLTVVEGLKGMVEKEMHSGIIVPH